MGNQKETQKNPQYKYASTREKLCFGIGAIGKDAICNLVGAFLMLYILSGTGIVGVLFFVARICDRYFVSGTGICRRTVFCSKNMGCDQ